MIPSGYPYDTHWVSRPYTRQGVCVWDFGVVCCVTNSLDMSQSRGPGPHGHEQTPPEQ